jgi:hypothetical protein
LNLRTAHILRTLVCIAMLVAFLPEASARYFQQQPGDTSRYPLRDRRGDPYTYPNRNSFDFRDTSYLKKSIEYDPKTKQYYIVEKIGSQYYRTPVSFSMEEFVRMQGKKDEEDYFKKRANLLANMNRRLTRPKFKVNTDWFNRMMGVGPDGKIKVDIRPSGYIDILAGYQARTSKTRHCPNAPGRTAASISI